MKKKKQDQFVIKTPYTFWNEETQLSEFHWNGFVLTGTNEATMEMLDYVNNVEHYRNVAADGLRDVILRGDRLLDNLILAGRTLDGTH